MFKHSEIKLNLPDLKSTTTESGRFYFTPDGKSYPSVTTVLSKISDNTWLEKWKERVGEDEVKRISTQAATRGTAVHSLAEQYLLNNPSYKKGHMPSNIQSFNHIKPYLDEHLSEIIGLEIPLYSDFLQTAGRTDCIGIWDNKLSVIDFKTSKRVKSKEDIKNYFLQASCYGYMFFERTGILINQIVILMTVDDSEPLVFVEKTRNYIEEFIQLRKSILI